MNEQVKKEILELLGKTIKILEVREEEDVEELKELSDHGVEGVALHKDLDLISVTVLVYSIYKVSKYISEENYKDLLAELKFAQQHLAERSLGKYNKNIRTLFEIVRKCDAKVKDHLADVLHAARIKKGTTLLSKGLSIGQAAGLMGLSNWDLQEYAARTVALEQHKELMPAKKRMMLALKIFGK